MYKYWYVHVHRSACLYMVKKDTTLTLSNFKCDAPLIALFQINARWLM